MPELSHAGTAKDDIVSQITTEIRRGGPEVIEGIAVSWCDLWQEASGSAFFRPEWVLAYLRSFESKPDVWLVTASVGERLIAVLPLVRETGLFRGLPVRQLCGAACIHSCHFDLLRAPGALGIAATKAIWHALEHTNGWDLIRIPFTPSGGNAIDLRHHAEQAGFPTAADIASRSRFINIVDCCNGNLNVTPPLRPHFRKDLRRCARRLEEVVGVPPNLMLVREADASLLQSFYELEASGWKGREGTAVTSRADTRMFYDEAARIGSKLGCFRLALLQAKGRTIAGGFTMITGKTLLTLKLAYDEGSSHVSPGHLLLEAILRRCADEGITELEFGGDDENYKRVWTPLTRNYLCIYVFNRGRYGRLLRFHKLVVVPWMKHILSRIGKREGAAARNGRSNDASPNTS